MKSLARKLAASLVPGSATASLTTKRRFRPGMEPLEERRVLTAGALVPRPLEIGIGNVGLNGTIAPFGQSNYVPLDGQTEANILQNRQLANGVLGDSLQRLDYDAALKSVGLDYLSALLPGMGLGGPGISTNNLLTPPSLTGGVPFPSTQPAGLNLDSMGTLLNGYFGLPSATPQPSALDLYVAEISAIVKSIAQTTPPPAQSAATPAVNTPAPVAAPPSTPAAAPIATPIVVATPAPAPLSEAKVEPSIQPAASTTTSVGTTSTAQSTVAALHVPLPTNPSGGHVYQPFSVVATVPVYRIPVHRASW